MGAILPYVLQVLEALPSLVEAGTTAYQLLEKANAAVKAMQAQNRGPTADEWAALDAAISAAISELK